MLGLILKRSTLRSDQLRMKKSIIHLTLFALTFASSAFLPAQETKEPGEWISLFDGTSTKGWRGYNGLVDIGHHMESI